MADIDTQIRAWLKDTVKPEVKTLLDGEIGEYVFPNGERHPAIWLDIDGEQAEPDGFGVEGLEVVISRGPDTLGAGTLDGQGYNAVVTITLKQWDTSKTSYAAMLKLQSMGQLITSTVRTPRSTRLNNIDASVITIQKPYLICSPAFL